SALQALQPERIAQHLSADCPVYPLSTPAGLNMPPQQLLMTPRQVDSTPPQAKWPITLHVRLLCNCSATSARSAKCNNTFLTLPLSRHNSLQLSRSAALFLRSTCKALPPLSPSSTMSDYTLLWS